MKSTLLVIAALLLVSWLIGIFAFSAGYLIHVLPVLAGASLILAVTSKYENV